MAAVRSTFTLLLSVFVFLTGCNADSYVSAKNAAVPPDYLHYRKGDISLAVPISWEFSFDDSPSLYADREVSFKVSNYSRVSLLILKDRERKTARVVDHYVDEFQINSDPLLTSYERSSTTIAGFPGEQITWSDTMAGKSDFEFTVIKVQDEPYDAFVIFNLSDEDIAKNGVHKAQFTQSIKLY